MVNINLFLTDTSGDIYREIFLNLNDHDLTNIFLTNKRIEKICNDEYFWNLRIQRRYRSDLSKYKNNKTYKDIYIGLSARGKRRRTALRESYKSGYLPVVRYLIESSNFNFINCYNSLKLSAEYGHLSIVQYLIEHGADIHAYGDDSLLCASRRGHLDVVKHLIERGADFHVENYEAVNLAAWNSHYSVVEYLHKCMEAIRGNIQ